MKTKPINWTTLLLVTVCCVIFSCTNQDNNQKDLALAKADSIIRADSIKWNNLLEPHDKSSKAILNRPVEIAFANYCMQGYRSWYKNPQRINTEFLKNAYTYAVVFEGDKLQEWLNSTMSLEKGTEIRVCLGVYTKKALEYAEGKGYLTPEQRVKYLDTPRLTVILRAYKNGKSALIPNTNKPLPAYNLGNLKP